MSALNLIEEAERVLNVWLVDNTDGPFEDAPEIDRARDLLINAIEKMRAAGRG